MATQLMAMNLAKMWILRLDVHLAALRSAAHITSCKQNTR